MSTYYSRTFWRNYCRGTTVEAIGYGFLLNFPVPNIRIYYVPNCTANVISIGQLAVYGGCKIIQEGSTLTVFNKHKQEISKTIINEKTLHHCVPSDWIRDQLPSLSNLATTSQAFSKFWTKDELRRMTIASELHEFLNLRNNSMMKKGLRTNSYGLKLNLLPVDLDNQKATRDGDCVICLQAKIKNIPTPQISLTPPCIRPRYKAHFDLQSLPCPSVGRNRHAFNFVDDACRFKHVNGVN